jgi:thymidylate synthase (FAD)
MRVSSMNVELLDHMGTDLTVVNSARVSLDKESAWGFNPSGMPRAGERYLSDADTKLVNYLAKHNHWSPFAHTSIQLRVKAPIFVARQLVKHQIGLSWNEVSRRYVDSEPEFFFPDVWRGRPEGSIKQGSVGVANVPEDRVEFVIKQSLDLYLYLIAHDNVAPEQARMVLPQNMMTEWYWTGSLMAFCRVCRERLGPGAQAETREVAEMIAEIVAPLFPVSWAALMGENS